MRQMQPQEPRRAFKVAKYQPDPEKPSKGRKSLPLGICNYCGAPKQVYEQEDDYKVLFRACLECLRDIVQGYRPPTEPAE